MPNASVYSKILNELEDFQRNKVTIAGAQREHPFGGFRLDRNKGGYDFSQSETLELIDLYYNSKFESSQYDSEGHRKLFLNVVNFIQQVARKNTDLDVKDYTFIPRNQGAIWPTWFFRTTFKQWAQEKKHGKTINQLNDDYSKYGTCVIKKVGSDLKRVSPRRIKNTQDAESLKEAAESGGYVIEEHEMTYPEMKKMKTWDTEGLERFPGRTKVYERYGLIPESEIMEGGDQEKDVLCLAIAAMQTKMVNGKKQLKGHLLFKGKISEIPYREAHWERQDGRWLGIGEVEKQFENQIARNTIANMRRRSLNWASKKVFQSTDQLVSRNLVRDVQDGDVLEITPGGEISQIATESRNLGEYAAADALWESNAREKSFTFEVATGESLPSRTPFRLGVILSNTVQAHFDLKRENFGLFLKESFFELLIPIFKKEYREEVLSLLGDDEGVETLKKALVEVEVNNRAKNQILSGKIPNLDEIREEVETKMNNTKNFFVRNVNKILDKAKFYMTLSLTGEELDIKQKIETLTNLYTVLVQQGDPRADTLLTRIASLSGENIEATVGARPSQPTPLGSLPKSANTPNIPQPSNITV